MISVLRCVRSVMFNDQIVAVDSLLSANGLSDRKRQALIETIKVLRGLKSIRSRVIGAVANTEGVSPGELDSIAAQMLGVLGLDEHVVRNDGEREQSKVPQV